MPSFSLNQAMVLEPALLMASLTAPMEPVMPLTRPRRMLAPNSVNWAGSLMPNQLNTPANAW
ncbi:hypothetical protein D3C72_2119410 [compost metagenome]